MIYTSTYPEVAQVLERGNLGTTWSADARKTMPEGDIPFLKPDNVAINCALAGFDEEAVPYVQSRANSINNDPDLKCLAWHCHYLLCHAESYPRSHIRDWEPLTEVLADRAGAFYLLLALAALPKIKAFHQSRGIPDDIARNTYSDTSLWADDYKAKHGTWGINLHILPWLFNHLSGELYRLGRLQFIQRPFRQKLHAFRNRDTREVIVLATEGVKYRSDGQIDGTGGEFDTEKGWTSRLLMEESQAIGTPIDPAGIALSTEATLPLDTWESILCPGDPILEIHIPAGGPMDFNACGESFRLAIDFFPRHFPDRPFEGFCCASWLLNTQFQDWLSPESNLVRFQRELYLFPIFSGGRSGIDRIFGGEVHDFSKAPRDTSLRRAVLDHIEVGGYLRGGGALLFPEDLAWGRQIYQRANVQPKK